MLMLRCLYRYIGVATRVIVLCYRSDGVSSPSNGLFGGPAREGLVGGVRHGVQLHWQP